MNRKRFFDVLKIIVSLVLIVFILRGIELDKLIGVLVNANPVLLGLTVLLVFIGVVLRAWRWKILLDVLKVGVPIRELTEIYLVGFLFNNLLPSGLGGDAIRMIELNRHSSRASDAVTSVFVDRLLGLFAALTLALIALIFRWNVIPSHIAFLSIIIFVGILGGGFFLINEPLYRIVRKVGLIRWLTDIKFINSLFQSFQDYSPAALGQSFLVSLVFNVLLITQNMFIGLSLGADVALAHYLVFVPIASIVLILPISFAGLGVREGAYVYLFSQIGVAEEVALGISLLVYFLGNVTPGLVGGVVYLWRSARRLQLETGD
jgi:hypothetical protein